MTTLEFFPAFFLAGVALLAALALLHGRNQRSPMRALCLFGLGIYTLWIASMTLFPIHAPTDPGSATPAAEIFARIHLQVNDFGRLFELAPGYSLREIGGNYLLWIPFGIGVPLVARPNLKRFALSVIGFGLGFELGQLLIALAVRLLYRSVDINDVLLNSLGVVTGWALFWIAARVARWLKLTPRALL